MLNNLPLNVALVLALVIGLLVTAGLSGWHQLHNHREVLTRELHKFHEQTAETLAIGIRDPMWHFLPEWGTEFVRSIMLDERLVEVLAEDTANDLVFLHKKNPHRIAKGQVLLIKKPVLFEGNQIGIVSVSITTHQMEKALKEEQTRLIFVVILQLCTGLLILLPLMYFKVLNPIQRLILQSEKLAQKKLEQPFIWKQTDELGTLGKSFENTRQALATLFQENEQKTQELSDALTDLKGAQKQLVESEKMAALGSLVAGVAHEIKTPVGNAFTAVTTLRERTKELTTLFEQNQVKRGDFKQFLQDTDEGAKMAQTNIEQAAELIKNFKQVAVDQTSEAKRRFNLKTYLEDEVILSVKPQLKHTPHVLEVVCTENIELDSYPGAFLQIITNFVNNSLMHAFTAEQPGHILITAYVEDHTCILTYRDNGKGMPPEVLEKIFEPFFTTNRMGGGTGLGMHIIYNLVNQKLGGKINCHSEIGKGVEFVVKLPVAKSA